MNTRYRRIILWLLNAIGAVVGAWALLAPRSFYDTFPSAGFGPWVGVDGPFNEHLIRDVGAMYLALGGASIGSLIWRSELAFRILGIAWTIFGVLHFAYHALHLSHMPMLDAVGEMIALGVSLLLGIVLLIPTRDPGRPREL